MERGFQRDKSRRRDSRSDSRLHITDDCESAESEGKHGRHDGCSPKCSVMARFPIPEQSNGRAKDEERYS